MTSGAESNLALLIRRHRHALGLTQEELAERAGISARAVSDIERGLRRLIYRDTARRLSTALGLGPQESEVFEIAARGPGTTRGGEETMPDISAVPLTRLIGRESELTTIGALLLSADTRLLTLVGPGGVGKTRLALELCEMVADAFEDGVCFVQLGGIRDPRLVSRAIATALKVRDAGAEPVAAVAARLRDKQMLLVLDTLEHVLDAAPVIAEIVGLAPSIRLLATSRSPLKLRGERQITVNPLDSEPAVALFTERAQAVTNLEPDHLDRQTVVEICQRLEGVPLAIELAAARVRHLSLPEILNHLEQRFSILSGGPVDLPPRQQTMAATVAWSYDLLGSAERRLLESLSVFVGGCSFDSAAAVCLEEASGHDLLECLSALVDCSLVLRQDGEQGAARYRMLDMVREYAGERLRNRVKQAGVQELGRRHAVHFLALAERAEPLLRTSEHRDWMQRLSAERDNLRAALSHSLANDEALLALRLSGALWMFWRADGAFSEGRAWLEEALSMDSAAQGPERARAIWGRGWLAYQQGDFVVAASCGTELLRWSTSADDRTSERNAVTLLGQSDLAEASYDSAAGHFDRALDIARELDSSWLVGTSLLNRSVAAIHCGDRARARMALNEARSIFESLGDELFLARVALQASFLALLEGDIRKARDQTMAALQAVAALGDRWAVAEQLDGLTAIYAASGEAIPAARLAGAAGAIWESIGARPHPTDRVSTERWLTPVLEGASQAEVTVAVAEGRSLGLSAAVKYALDLPEVPG